MQGVHARHDCRTVLDMRNCPAKRLLVLGNHDVDPVNQVRPLDVDRTAVTLFARATRRCC